MTAHLRLTLVVLVTTAIQAAPAAAQGDPRTAPNVCVTMNAPRSEVTGVLLELSPETVRLLVGGQEQRIPLDDVRRIQRRGDSLKNGAVIGALLLGGWCAVVCGQGLDHAGQLLPAVAVNGALGALLGAGVDALHTGRTTIYQRAGAVAGVPRPRGVALLHRVRL